MKLHWKTIAPLVVWLVIYLLQIPAGLNANQWHYFAVFAAVITGLVLESMPVGAVGLIGLTFAAVMGYVESDPNKSLRWALSGFAESTVWLIVGAFVFAIGYRRADWQSHRRAVGTRLGRRTLGRRHHPPNDTAPATLSKRHAAVVPSTRSWVIFQRSMARSPTHR
jgi:citrate:succinate antiporter/L-tartrate/succinate antiporter